LAGFTLKAFSHRCSIQSSPLRLPTSYATVAVSILTAVPFPSWFRWEIVPVADARSGASDTVAALQEVRTGRDAGLPLYETASTWYVRFAERFVLHHQANCIIGSASRKRDRDSLARGPTRSRRALTLGFSVLSRPANGLRIGEPNHAVGALSNGRALAGPLRWSHLASVSWAARPSLLSA